LEYRKARRVAHKRRYGDAHSLRLIPMRIAALTTVASSGLLVIGFTNGWSIFRASTENGL